MLAFFPDFSGVSSIGSLAGPRASAATASIARDDAARASLEKNSAASRFFREVARGRSRRGRRSPDVRGATLARAARRRRRGGLATTATFRRRRDRYTLRWVDARAAPDAARASCADILAHQRRLIAMRTHCLVLALALAASSARPSPTTRRPTTRPSASSRPRARPSCSATRSSAWTKGDGKTAADWPVVDGVGHRRQGEHPDQGEVRRLPDAPRVQRPLHARGQGPGPGQQRRLPPGELRAPGPRLLRPQAPEQRLRRDLSADHPGGQRLQAAAPVADLRHHLPRRAARGGQGRQEGPAHRRPERPDHHRRQGDLPHPRRRRRRSRKGRTARSCSRTTATRSSSATSGSSR